MLTSIMFWGVPKDPAEQKMDLGKAEWLLGQGGRGDTEPGSSFIGGSLSNKVFPQGRGSKSGIFTLLWDYFYPSSLPDDGR